MSSYRIRRVHSGDPASSDFLMHFGIRGMKWGVRRFQNEDGSYTAAGRERYGVGQENDKPVVDRKRSSKEYKDDRALIEARKSRHDDPDVSDEDYARYKESAKQVKKEIDTLLESDDKAVDQFLDWRKSYADASDYDNILRNRLRDAGLSGDKFTKAMQNDKTLSQLRKVAKSSEAKAVSGVLEALGYENTAKNQKAIWPFLYDIINQDRRDQLFGQSK